MSEHELTREERRSLQLWFRQAIAEVERAEVKEQLLRRHGVISGTHRQAQPRRHTIRGTAGAHHREVAAI